MTVYSQTEINQENVQGKWIKEGSPYIINNNITILAGDTLEIDKGVQILFKENIKITVSGSIYANGESGDSITFSSFNENSRWKGIIYNSNQNNSKLTYCKIENAGKKTIEDGNLKFSNQAGGAMNLSGKAYVEISNCLVKNNCAIYGGAFYVDNSNVKIINTEICFNESSDGAAFYFGEKISNIITGCSIHNNISHANSCIYTSHQGYTSFVNNTIVKNTVLNEFGMIVQFNGTCYLTNTIIYHNSPVKIGNGYLLGYFLKIQNCDIENGISNIKPEGIPLSKFEYQNNIDVLPLFLDLDNNDFRLSKSPCINKGNTSVPSNDYQYDIIGNKRIFDEPNKLIDIGAYEYQGNLPNRPPVIKPIETKYLPKNSSLKVKVQFYDAEEKDHHTFTFTNNNTNVEVQITDTICNGFWGIVKAKNSWEGKCIIYLTVTDDSYSSNSTYKDTICFQIGKYIKGNYNSNLVLEDSAIVIGDITMEDSCITEILAGTKILFMDSYKIFINGKFNAVGNPEKKIIFNAQDTGSFEMYDILHDKGWGGIVIDSDLESDSIIFDYCIIKNTGLSEKNHNFNYTVEIDSTNNIFFNNCVFDSNYSFGICSGLTIRNSQNIYLKNCIFSDSYNYDANYLDVENSKIFIDSCSFLNSYLSKQGKLGDYSIKCKKSDITIKNSFFYNNQRYTLINSDFGKLEVYNCKFDSNHGQVVNAYHVEDDSLMLINNFVTNNITIGGQHLIELQAVDDMNSFIIGNIFAYNISLCNCSNMLGGVLTLGSGAFVANNTFVGNYQDDYGYTLIYNPFANHAIFNNIFWNNKNMLNVYYKGQNLSANNPNFKNNFFSNPNFKLTDSIDFNLKNGSECIDSGIVITSPFLPTLDIYGNPRVDTTNNIIDIGAMEYTKDVISGIQQEPVPSNNNLIYPNPVSDIIYFKENFRNFNYSIFNINGKLITKGIINSNNIKLKQLTPGVYFIFFKNAEFTYNSKFVKIINNSP